MGPSPLIIISPFSVGTDFSALARHRKRCNLDGCTSDGTMKCTGCNTAKYCSKECQLAHWRQIHKQTCQNPTVESTFVPEIPSSWRETRASVTTAPSESIRFARLVHDDTHRGKTVDTPAIYSLASRPSLLSYFEHHSGDNDASFTICLADGHGAFLSAELYNSIPSAHRPKINLCDAGKPVQVLYRPDLQTLGSVMMPVILKTADTNEWIKLIIYTFVLADKMPVPMFISWKALVDSKPQWGITGIEKKMFVHLENEQGAFNIQGL